MMTPLDFPCITLVTTLVLLAVSATTYFSSVRMANDSLQDLGIASAHIAASAAAAGAGDFFSLPEKHVSAMRQHVARYLSVLPGAPPSGTANDESLDWISDWNIPLLAQLFDASFEYSKMFILFADGSILFALPCPQKEAHRRCYVNGWFDASRKQKRVQYRLQSDPGTVLNTTTTTTTNIPDLFFANDAFEASIRLIHHAVQVSPDGVTWMPRHLDGDDSASTIPSLMIACRLTSASGGYLGIFTITQKLSLLTRSIDTALRRVYPSLDVNALVVDSARRIVASTVTHRSFFHTTADSVSPGEGACAFDSMGRIGCFESVSAYDYSPLRELLRRHPHFVLAAHPSDATTTMLALDFDTYVVLRSPLGPPPDYPGVRYELFLFRPWADASSIVVSSVAPRVAVFLIALGISGVINASIMFITQYWQRRVQYRSLKPQQRGSEGEEHSDLTIQMTTMLPPHDPPPSTLSVVAANDDVPALVSPAPNSVMRKVTALFCIIRETTGPGVESVAFSSQLLLAKFAEVTSRCGGYSPNFFGDNILSVFDAVSVDSPELRAAACTRLLFNTLIAGRIAGIVDVVVTARSGIAIFATTTTTTARAAIANCCSVQALTPELLVGSMLGSISREWGPRVLLAGLDTAVAAQLPPSSGTALVLRCLGSHIVQLAPANPEEKPKETSIQLHEVVGTIANRSTNVVFSPTPREPAQATSGNEAPLIYSLPDLLLLLSMKAPVSEADMAYLTTFDAARKLHDAGQSLTCLRVLEDVSPKYRADAPLQVLTAHAKTKLAPDGSTPRCCARQTPSFFHSVFDLPNRTEGSLTSGTTNISS